MPGTKKGGLVFISCGQLTDAEKGLGNEVCRLIRELTPHEPYFAENQNSLEALTRNILGALDDAVGLIAIMHPRGIVTFPDNRRKIRASIPRCRRRFCGGAQAVLETPGSVRRETWASPRIG